LWLVTRVETKNETLLCGILEDEVNGNQQRELSQDASFELFAMVAPHSVF
jgi:hypothetical protein